MGHHRQSVGVSLTDGLPSIAEGRGPAIGDCMIEDMSARQLTPPTQKGHIRACKRFAAFLKRSPDTATAEKG